MSGSRIDQYLKVWESQLTWKEVETNMNSEYGTKSWGSRFIFLTNYIEIWRLYDHHGQVDQICLFLIINTTRDLELDRMKRGTRGYGKPVKIEHIAFWSRVENNIDRIKPEWAIYLLERNWPSNTYKIKKKRDLAQDLRVTRQGGRAVSIVLLWPLYTNSSFSTWN